jgi:hypothetical protein
MRLTDGTDVEFDEHSGSRRSDVWDELRRQTPAGRLPDAAADFAVIRASLNELETRIKAQFGVYETTRGFLEEAGIVAQMKLSPILDAAYGAWLRDREVPRRLELSEISEAPIPPEEAC